MEHILATRNELSNFQMIDLLAFSLIEKMTVANRIPLIHYQGLSEKNHQRIY